MLRSVERRVAAEALNRLHKCALLVAYPVSEMPIISNTAEPSAFKVNSATIMLNRIKSSLAFQAEALKLRSQRQQLLAANIANADTPNYKPVDFDFATALTKATSTSAQRASEQGRPVAPPDALPRPGAKAGLDGNAVDMDTERTQFVDNAVRYEATLRFINGKLKTLLSAIQG